MRAWQRKLITNIPRGSANASRQLGQRSAFVHPTFPSSPSLGHDARGVCSSRVFAPSNSNRRNNSHQSSSCRSIGGVSSTFSSNRPEDSNLRLGNRVVGSVRQFSSGARDPYSVLGIPPNSSEADVKKAYRSLAKKWHPDRHPGDRKEEAERRFKEVGEAYERITNPTPQQQMPPGFEQGFPGGFPGGGFPSGFAFHGGGFSFRMGGGFPGGSPFGGPQHPFQGADIEDLLNEMLGGGGRQQQPTVIGPGDTVTITENMRLMSEASRRSELDKADDSLRVQSRGKSGRVLAVNARNQTAKVEVEGVGEVWLPAPTLGKKQPERSHRMHQRHQQSSSPGQEISTTIHVEQGPDGKLYAVKTRRIRTPQGIREEVTRELFSH